MAEVLRAGGFLEGCVNDVRCGSVGFAQTLWLAFALAASGCAAGSVPAGTVWGARGGRLDQAAISLAVSEAVARHGAGHTEAIARGVSQVAPLWRAEDGDLAAFVADQFLVDPAQRAATFTRFEAVFEQLDGSLLEMGRALRGPSDVDCGPPLPVDGLFAAFDPSAHMGEDLFRSRLAFVALLNCPVSTVAERLTRADVMTRRDWAEARLTGRFTARVPAEVRALEAAARAAADAYVSGYDLWMHHVVGLDGARLFPSGKRLISHWNLRDEIKAQYAAGAEGLARQRVIARAMARIVDQSIPVDVIGNPRVDWEPVSNRVTLAAEGAVEADAPTVKRSPRDAREPDTRYALILENFRALRAADPYVPSAPSPLARAFELGRELPVARVEALLTEVVAAPVVAEVMGLMRARLGRPLEPHDLWYDGFKARASMPEANLDAIVRARFPDAASFERALGPILVALGFPAAQADRLAGLIKVDASRGAGHAMPAARRGDFPRLRTRIGPDGMDYKGFNIAIHELGHNVEQVHSLYDVDHTLLAGVPNNAFTEALAFVLQARDLQVLGLSLASDPRAEAERTLATFVATWEIAGVALLEIALWRWLEAHPDATPAELRTSTVRLARELWARHYAPHLGDGEAVDGALLLGVYSHLVSYPLYLANYPLGHLIAFQIEQAIAQAEAAGEPLGAAFARMARIGAVAPDVWMTQATGGPVAAIPLIRAATAAVTALRTTDRTTDPTLTRGLAP